MKQRLLQKGDPVVFSAAAREEQCRPRSLVELYGDHLMRVIEVRGEEYNDEINGFVSQQVIIAYVEPGIEPHAEAKELTDVYINTIFLTYTPHN